MCLAWLGDDVGWCWWILQQEIIHIYWFIPRLTLFYSVSILICISFMYNFDKMVRKQKMKYLDLASNRLAINSLNVLSQHSSDKSLCMLMRKSCSIGWSYKSRTQIRSWYFFWNNSVTFRPLRYISIKFQMSLSFTSKTINNWSKNILYWILGNFT